MYISIDILEKRRSQLITVYEQYLQRGGFDTHAPNILVICEGLLIVLEYIIETERFKKMKQIEKEVSRRGPNAKTRKTRR